MSLPSAEDWNATNDEEAGPPPPPSSSGHRQVGPQGAACPMRRDRAIASTRRKRIANGTERNGRSQTKRTTRATRGAWTAWCVGPRVIDEW